METKQTQEMEKIIRKYFQCWLDKSIDPIKDIFSKNITYSECYGPIYTGLEQVITWFAEWNQKGTVDGFDGVTIAEFDADGKINSLETRVAYPVPFLYDI